METRPLGETGHESSVLTFGAIALDPLDQPAATDLANEVLDAGVNHVDVAPSYGTAEVKLAPVLEDRRDEVFLGCKTLERTSNGAWGEIHRSLDRLGVDHLDLYQFHAVTRYDELDAITGDYSPEMAQSDDEGALAAVLDAKERGLVDHVGLTSHGDPSVIRAAIERIPELDTVMFPFNATLDAREGPEYDYRSVLDLARERGLGTLCIKAFAKGPWPEDLAREDRPYHTWYEPYDDPEELRDCLRYALSQEMTTIPNAGDPELVRPILEAAGDYEPMTDEEQAAFRAAAKERDSPVPRA